MQKKIASTSVVSSEAKCSTSIGTNEKEKKNDGKETCSVYSSTEAGATVSTLPSETSVLNESSMKMDIRVIDIAKEPSKSNTSADLQHVVEHVHGESSQTSEHEQMQPPRTPEESARISGLDIPQRRRHSGTILWEPLLVPSELDGKVEMITTLKRVDSDYVCSPRTNTRKSTVPLTKESLPPTSSKVIVPKETIEMEKRRSNKKEIPTKKKGPGVNINEQMGRAIAEKEAAILKEIEKAMKEATNTKSKSIPRESGVSSKNKSYTSNEPAKAKASMKFLQSQNIKKRTMGEVHNSVSEGKLSIEYSGSMEGFSGNINEIYLPEGTKLIQSLPSKDVHGINRILTVPGTVYTTSAPSVTSDIHGLSKLLTVPGKVVTGTSSVVGSISKETQVMNKILTVPGKVMMAPTLSTGGSVIKDGQPLSTVLCGPATMIATPGSSVVTNASKDALTLNKLIALPVNTKSSKEISPPAVQRIILLASPGAAISSGIPLLTPIIPTSGRSVTHAPVGLPAKTIKGTSPDKRESRRVGAHRGKSVKDSSSTLSESSAQHTARKFVGVEEYEVGPSRKGHSMKLTSVSSQKPMSSQDIVPQNKEVLSQNNQPPLDMKKPLRYYSKQSQSPSVNVQNGEKQISAPLASKQDAFMPTEKQEGTDNANILCDVRMNGKATGIQEKSQSFLSDSRKVDCNGGSMDVDEESISEEMDQGSGDDLRNVVDSKAPVAAEVNIHSQRNKNHVRENKISEKYSSRKGLQKKSADVSSSDMILENRLRRIEQLYCEIPPAKSRISLTEEDYSKIRDGFRNSMRVVKAVSASFKSLVGESHSLGCKEYVHSSCQTENTRENDFSGVTTNSITDIVKAAPADTVSDDKPDDVEADHILCRLCGGFFQKTALIALFSKLSKRKKLLTMLSTILPQSPPVQESDGLPQQVCAACIDKLTLCHDIINQFLQADKELRQVLQEEKPVATSSVSVEEEIDSGSLSENKTHPEKNEAKTVEDITVHLKPCEVPDHTSTNETLSKTECSKSNTQSHVQKHGEKRTHAVLDSERLPAESHPDHKHKRRRSRSPKRSGPARKDSHAPSKSSTGCIDLSRLDPEFNDGFEVEWCLDEETIRSSMVPEEETGPDLNENLLGADVCGSSEGGIGTENNFSAAPVIQGCVELPTDTLESPPTEVSQLKANDSLCSELPKLVDEVSKLSEMHTSVCESTAKSDSKQSPVSAVLQEKHHVEPIDLFESRETYKCSSCPLSFPSKQEAFLHKVMQHEEELTGVLKPHEGKENSIPVIQSEDLPQKQTCPPDSKIESERCEEAMMCDQCGLPFPNEYSLCIHKCVAHENDVDPQSVIKDTKGSETKIVNSKELVEENQACKEILDTLLTDGKMLVKCGRSGMLWVSCSKLFSDTPLGAAQSSDQNGVPCASVENDTVSIVSSQQNISNVSSQNVARVQFAYKCDHCKQIFPGRSELLNHMKTHITDEYSCSECGVKFSTMDNLNNHIPTHIPHDRVCDECGLILLDSKKLLQHRKEHTHNLPHVCESCGKRFPNEQTLEVHEPIHYNKRGPLACSLCRKCFFFKHTLVRHRSQHASNRLQKCSLCFRVLNTSDQLRKHIALHHLMKNYVCFCKQTFPSQKELVEHRYLKHTYAEIFCARYKVEILEPLPLHQCSICYRVLNSKQSLLKHHVTSHSSTWPFYCIQCSRKYTSMLHLARHECHRKNTLAFQCRICGRAFQNKNIFKQHKIIHDHKKWKYICRHCGKAFRKSQSLVSHIMTHGGKSFSCPRCHLQCQDKEGLLKHYNTGSCLMKGKTLQ